MTKTNLDYAPYDTSTEFNPRPEWTKLEQKQPQSKSSARTVWDRLWQAAAGVWEMAKLSTAHLTHYLKVAGISYQIILISVTNMYALPLREIPGYPSVSAISEIPYRRHVPANNSPWGRWSTRIRRVRYGYQLGRQHITGGAVSSPWRNSVWK